jgi:hypothetical protein
MRRAGRSIKVAHSDFLSFSTLLKKLTIACCKPRRASSSSQKKISFRPHVSKSDVGATFVPGAIWSCIRISWPAIVGTFLLTGRERLVEFSIYQEVPENPAGTPSDAVSPVPNSRGVLFVDKDAAFQGQQTWHTTLKYPRGGLMSANNTSSVKNSN